MFTFIIDFLLYFNRTVLMQYSVNGLFAPKRQLYQIILICEFICVKKDFRNQLKSF